MKPQPDGRGPRWWNGQWEDWHGERLRQPYGHPDDVLWVRETWGRGTTYDGFTSTLYRADADLPEIRWKPSIHMPKAAARIWLQVESVGVERLQGISEADAIAEGVEKIDPSKFARFGPDPKDDHVWQNYSADSHKCYRPTARESYQTLWSSINGLDSWGQNPYVWVIKFKRIDGPVRS